MIIATIKHLRLMLTIMLLSTALVACGGGSDAGEPVTKAKTTWGSMTWGTDCWKDPCQ